MVETLSEFAGDFWYSQRCRNSSTTCCPPTTRGIGMSLWIVLCGLLIVTLPRNMGRPVLSTGVGAPFPTAWRDQGDPAFDQPQINPPRVGPERCPGLGLFITLMPTLFVSPESRSCPCGLTGGMVRVRCGFRARTDTLRAVAAIGDRRSDRDNRLYLLRVPLRVMLRA